MLQQILKKKIQNNLIKNELEKKEAEERAEAIKNQMPQIQDTTDMNETGTINFSDYMDWIKQDTAERRAYQDKIRKETWEREDNAYQRAVEDMKKAGINPNLFGSFAPSASGGGLVTDTGANWDPLSEANKQQLSYFEKEMDKLMQEYQIAMDQAFQGDQNAKDRAIEIFKGLMQFAGLATLKKGG